MKLSDLKTIESQLKAEIKSYEENENRANLLTARRALHTLLKIKGNMKHA